MGIGPGDAEMSQPGQHEHLGKDGVGWDESSSEAKTEVMESGKTTPWNSLGVLLRLRWIWVMVMLWSLSQASHGCVVVISVSQ